MKRHLGFDFIGRRRTWFLISGAVVLVSALALLIQGLNLSIDFRGGSSFTVTGVTNQSLTADDLEDAAEEAGAQDARGQLIREGDDITGAIVQTRPIEPASESEQAVVQALQGTAQGQDVEVSFVGPTWGQRISAKMLQALVVFLVIVVIYISIRLEYKMAGAAIVALFHDLLLTAGVYAIFQFNVSPATVIALLTILGYSLYDTVIVFDRVNETADEGLGRAGRRTYGQAVNTAMNDVLWRSINTTITSGLPVAGLLFIGAQALGAATLQDLALALFVGMLTGAYSSLFIAGPVLVVAKEREPRLAALVERAERRGHDEEPEEVAREPDAPAEERLEPRGHVRGPGRTPRRKR